MERAEWALDNVVIAVNESATLGFEEHFNPMQPDVWYRAMNAVPRITCSSNNDALVFIKNGGSFAVLVLLHGLYSTKTYNKSL